MINLNPNPRIIDTLAAWRWFVWIFQIILVEFIREHCRSSINKPPGYQLTSDHSVPRFVFNCYKLIGTFLFGAAVNQSITDICKYAVGRLRPDFLAACQPHISAGICDGHVPGIYVYVDDFTCTLPESKGSRYVSVLAMKVVPYTDINRHHSFPRNAEFWFEPLNLAVSAEFLHFRGISWNLEPVGDKGINKAYFGRVQAAIENLLLYVDMMAPSNTLLALEL